MQRLFQELVSNYSRFYESTVQSRRFKYKDVIPFIESINDEPGFERVGEGQSFNGQRLYHIQWGLGDRRILLWAQMHGDESTASRAVLDIFNFLKSKDDKFDEVRRKLREELSVHFIPVLNPDGADSWQRHTLQGIDMNRDALALQTPEGKFLKDICDATKPEFGFNLHDQSPYYGTGDNGKPASISFLAPAFNEEKEVNDVRAKAMQLIGLMRMELEELIPGQIGKYDDTFNMRAFGDNIQKWGVSTILIESGGQFDDPEKEELRKINFATILMALNAIAVNQFQHLDLSNYHSIPFNKSDQFFDLLLRRATIDMNGKSFLADIGINRVETKKEESEEYYYEGLIEAIGDLQTHYGYEEIDAKEGRVLPLEVLEEDEIDSRTEIELLQSGVGFIRVPYVIASIAPSKTKLNKINDLTALTSPISLNKNANFQISQDGDTTVTIINGFVVNSDKPNFGIANALELA